MEVGVSSGEGLAGASALMVGLAVRGSRRGASGLSFRSAAIARLIFEGWYLMTLCSSRPRGLVPRTAAGSGLPVRVWLTVLWPSARSRGHEHLDDAAVRVTRCL